MLKYPLALTRFMEEEEEDDEGKEEKRTNAEGQ